MKHSELNKQSKTKITAGDAVESNLLKFNSAIQEVISALNISSSLSDLAPKILNVVGEVLDCKSCGYYEVENGLIYLRYWYADGILFRPDELGNVHEKHRAVIRELASGFTVPFEYFNVDPILRTEPNTLDHLEGTAVPHFDDFVCRIGLRFEVNCPVVIKNIQVATLVALRADKKYEPEEIHFFKALANQFAIAIQLETSVQVARQLAVSEEKSKVVKERASELAKANSSLRQINERLVTAKSYDVALRETFFVGCKSMGAKDAQVSLLSSSSDLLVHTLGFSDGEIVDELLGHPFGSKDRPMPIEGKYSAWWNFVSKQSIFYTVSGSEAELSLNTLPWHESRGHRIVLLSPLLFGDEALGYFEIAFDDREDIGESQMEMFNAVAQQLTMALHMSRLAAIAQADSSKSAVLTERNRMARELHDSIAHSLTGILMQVRVAERFAHKNPEALAESLAELGRQAKSGLLAAREAVFSLQEGTDRYKNVAQSLQEIVRPFAQGQVEPQLSYSTEGLEYELDSNVGFAVCKIAQEALTNAYKYSQARKINLSVQFLPENFSLSISDDGIGFELVVAQESGGLGLSGMIARSRRIGADLNIQSSKDSGTNIYLRIGRNLN